MWVLRSLIIVYTGIRISVAISGPSSYRIWGIDFHAYLPLDAVTWFLLLLPLLPLLSLLPLLHGVPHVLDDLYKKFGKQKFLLFFAVALGLLSAIRFFPVYFAFLGDGALYLTEIFRILQHADYETSLIKPTSFLTGHSIRALTLLMKAESLMQPYVLLGFISAALHLVVLFIVLWKDGIKSYLLFLPMLFQAGMLLYFGYVELYALQFALVSAFYMTAFLAFKDKVNLWMPGVILFLAIASGGAAVILLPAYAYLVFVKPVVFVKPGKKKPGVTSAPRFTPLVFALLPAIAGILLAPSVYLMPAESVAITTGSYSAWDVNYTLFSAAHILDSINVVALATSGIFLFLLALPVLWKAVRPVDSKFYFGLIAVTASLALVFFGNKSFGMARDWDLAAMPLLSLTFLFAVMLDRKPDDYRKVRREVYVLVMLMMISVSALWIRVNADGPASAARFAALVEADRDKIDPNWTYNGVENLRKYHARMENSSGILNALASMHELGINSDNVVTKHLAIIPKFPDAEKRAREYRRLLDLLTELYQDCSDERAAALRQRIVRTLLVAAEQTSSETGLRMLAALESKVPGLDSHDEFRIANAWLLPDRSDHERKLMITSVDIAGITDPVLLYYAGVIFEQDGELDLAGRIQVRAANAGRELYPGFYLKAALVLFNKLGKRPEALAMLDSCLVICPGSRQASAAANLKRQITTLPEK